jgi:hypothetical protein
MTFILGLDLGQSQDYTALAILEKIGEKDAVYHVRHLERTRGTPYPEIVDRVTKLMSTTKLAGSALVIDQTGVGAAVFDIFKKSGMKPVGVQIHGGDKVTQGDDRSFRVPKRDLVGVLQVLLQSGRLKVAQKLALGPVLQQEMLNFKVKIDPATAHDSYSAWREAEHDDLVLAVALAAWYGERSRPKWASICVPAAPVVGGRIEHANPYIINI